MSLDFGTFRYMTGTPRRWFVPRDDGASPTALMIQPRGVGRESWIASAVTGWRPESAAQEGRASSDVGVARELESHTLCAARSYRVRESGAIAFFRKLYPAALLAASSVCILFLRLLSRASFQDV